MKDHYPIPEGEALCKAVEWLGHQPDKNVQTITEAATRFDLSPTEEEFLLHIFTSSEGRKK